MAQQAVQQQVKRSYKWCQYTGDAEHNLFTVQEIIERDYCKVYSQGAAIAMVEKLNKEAKNG